MKKYLAWIPALVIMTAIFWFSAQPADVSTEMSDSVTRALLWTAEAVGLTDRLSPEQVHDLCGLLATPVRKTAHITEFAVLHLTVLFALFQWELPWKKWLKAALAVTVAYACTDELHQLFVPGRAGTGRERPLLGGFYGSSEDGGKERLGKTERSGRQGGRRTGAAGSRGRTAA